MMLNENLSGLRRSGIRRFTNLAKEQPGCVMLTIGEPDFDTPRPIRAAAAEALERGRTHYAPNQGLPELVRAVAEYETKRGYAITPEQVIITAGATGALYTALTGILNPGDEVIVPMPAFPLYESIILAAGAKLVPLETAGDGFQITREALAAVLSEKTKAIVLNSPNNPTGVVYTSEPLAAVKDAVLGKEIFVICDNVYNQLCAEAVPDLSLDADLKEQILLCQSFSKPYAMTGWRVGYLAGPQAVMERLLLLHAAEVASIPTFLQAACVEALRTDISDMAASYERRRSYVCKRLTDMGLTYPKPTGAFYVFADISGFGMDSAELAARLIREAGVATVPGSCFGTEGYLRLSCCCSEENLKRGLDRLEGFIRRLSD